ncbi:uncharacterized protein [Antedon mediterranea]|uniref:uncharacterized protein n=1 Tax=Antedon mediterranea TaxID=105859 RepID=UPI003AF4B0CC
MTNISPAGQREIIREMCNAIQHGRRHDVETILDDNEEFINADEGGNMVAKSLYRNFLMLAIDALETDISTLLIDRGIDINHKCWCVNGKQSARDLAIENGLNDVVDMIDSRLPISMQLFAAVSDGSLTRTKQLISHIDADINMKVNLYGEKTPGCLAFTLLMIAIKLNHSDVAELLVQGNIDVAFQHQEWERLNPESDDVLVVSYTALELATQRGMYDVVKMIKGQQLKRTVVKDTNAIDDAKQADVDTNRLTNSQEARELPAAIPTVEQEARELPTSIPTVEQDHLDNNINKYENKVAHRQSCCCILS